MSVILEVKNLKKHFSTPKGQLHAVDGVNFTIEEGQTLGVVGESGCGKSTLGRVLVNLLPATDGQVLYKGEDITRADPHRIKELCREMQMVFQDPFSSLNPRMTVEDLIAEPLVIHNVCRSRIEREDRVDELMETVGLASRFYNSYPHEMDGGRRQRVGIARALALNPRFIVCDEPVSALDVSIQAQILNLMQDLQEEKNLTYLFITHNLSVVKHISDHIVVMYLGVMVEKCASRELFAHRLHPYTRALLSAIPLPRTGEKRNRILLKGELSSPINPKPGCRFAIRCPYAQELCFEKIPVLEELLPEHFVACHRARELNGL